MQALRHSGSSTSASASVVNALLRDPNTTKITFFGTEARANSSYDPKSDGAETDLPLLAALAEYTIPGFGPIYLVFDGYFLTRARTHRATEADQVIEEAVISGRARYAPQPVPFTSSMPPDQAALALNKSHTLPLDQNSVEGYRRILGGA